MRYMGGKSRIAKHIVTYINNIGFLEGINNYYEPFCGGCAVAEQVNIKNSFSKYYDWLKKISKNNFVLVSEYSMPNGFKEVDSWVMNTTFGTGIGNNSNSSSIERLFVVDGGYLVDKYFGTDATNF